MTSAPQKHVSLDKDRLETPITFYKRMAWILVLAGVLAAAWGVYCLKADLPGLGSYLQGATGSLFALAGLMFIYVAFLGQKQQLIIQNEQLMAQKRQFEEEQAIQKDLYRQQKEEAEAQRKRFVAQEQNNMRQNFESSFLQLLGLRNQIVSGIRDIYSKEVRKGIGVPPGFGRDCFETWYKAFRDTTWAPEAKLDAAGNIAIESKSVGERYRAFYVHYEGVLGHYFRNLYHVIKFVKYSAVEDKRRYTSLVRSTLSQFELALLFYNCLSPLGDEDFKPLVEEFGLLKNFNCDALLKPEHEALYDAKAFE